jgi:FkbM family methyltransferase
MNQRLGSAVDGETGEPRAAGGWLPTFSIAERLKQALIPPRVYIDYLYRKALLRGEAELRLLPRLADPRRASLDIGANKGVYSYALLKCSAKVHAFEPNPKLFAMLSRWAESRVALHPYALGDRAGTTMLHIPKSSRGRGFSNQGGTLLPILTREFESVPVEVKRLDDLDLGDVGFIKLDVEGYEREVIAGGTALLRRCRPVLLVEIEEKHANRPLPEMVAEICGHGYACSFLHGGTLKPFAELDVERQHRRPAARADYVFNFIFRPA